MMPAVVHIFNGIIQAQDIERKPQFIVFDNSIKTILPTLNSKIILTLDEQNIVNYLASGMLSSSSEIAQAMGYSKAKAIQLLNSLVEKRVLKIEGSGRGTKYRNV